MLNKFFKTIHNKYSKFFKFIFFLRYLFAVFFISLTIFLSVPYLFDYEQKSKNINNYLFKNYNFEINSYEKISYRLIPSPNIELKNVSINLSQSVKEFKIKSLRIFPKLLSIYNYDNFQSEKIIIKDNDIIFEISDIQNVIKKLFNQQKKLSIKNLNMKIMDNAKPIVILENVKFVNYGSASNLLTGKIFNKEFKIKVDKNFENINLKLINSGVKIDINFIEKNQPDLISGILKTKILNKNIKFNFDYDNSKIRIYNSYFRSKKLSFTNESSIIYDPFLDIDSTFNVEQLNIKIFKNLNLDEFLNFKDFIKKLNIKNEINFKPKKYNRSLFDEIKLKIDLAYGRANFSKRLLISDDIIECQGNINLLEEFPLLFFDCKVVSNNKKKFLKNFSVRTSSDEILNLNVKGTLNILNNKINFKDISLNEKYLASKEDLSFFKNTFEKILLDKSFIDIFNMKKIKNFILEVS